MTNVAIIGAGITGLTAAFRLAQRNIPVTVYEASDRVGGVIQSIRRDGYLAEFGPNTILETSPIIGSLIRDLGLEPRRLYSDPAANNRYLVRNHELLPVPASPVSFFTSRLFSANAKLHLLAEPFIRRAPAGIEESLAEFVLRRLGQEFLDYAINPLVAGIYAGSPAKLSVRHAFPKLEAIEQRYGSLILGQILGARERKRRAEVSKQDAKKVSFDEGLQVLTDELARRLGDNLLLNSPVMEIEQTPGGWTISARTPQGDQRREHAAILLAAPSHQLAGLKFQSRQPASLEPLKAIYYPPVTSIVVGYRREDVAHPLDGFGALVPEVENLNILGVLFSSSLFPNRAPQGHVLLTCYMGGVRNPSLALRPSAELSRLVQKDLGILLGARGKPTFEHQRIYHQAIPQYEVGYGRFKVIMDQAEAQCPGLYFAGHYREGISLGDSLVSGDLASEKIAAFLAAAGRKG